MLIAIENLSKKLCKHLIQSSDYPSKTLPSISLKINKRISMIIKS